jgi:hypothetical protein
MLLVVALHQGRHLRKATVRALPPLGQRLGFGQTVRIQEDVISEVLPFLEHLICSNNSECVLDG